MANWTLVDGAGGLRMEPSQLRAMGQEDFTWAHLLYGKLGVVKAGIFYFPSRFESATDQLVTSELRTFGRNSDASISVNFWDSTDPQFTQALALFGLRTIPAVVLASGLQIAGMEPRGPTKTPLYSIVFDSELLSDTNQFRNAVNSAAEVLARSDPKEIAGYIRSRKSQEIAGATGKVLAAVRDEILRWKPKFGIPGGFSIEVG